LCGCSTIGFVEMSFDGVSDRRKATILLISARAGIGHFPWMWRQAVTRNLCINQCQAQPIRDCKSDWRSASMSTLHAAPPVEPAVSGSRACRKSRERCLMSVLGQCSRPPGLRSAFALNCLWHWRLALTRRWTRSATPRMAPITQVQSVEIRGRLACDGTKSGHRHWAV
jgi:hypothetical protein